MGSRRSGDCVNGFKPATAFSGILTEIPIPPNRENSYISGLISGCALGTVDGSVGRSGVSLIPYCSGQNDFETFCVSPI